MEPEIIEFSTILENWKHFGETIGLNHYWMADIKTGTTPWSATGAERRTFVQGMFGDIAPIYDRLNGVMSLRLHHRWRRFAVSLLEIAPGSTVLDLCTGTGDFLEPLRNAVGNTGRILAIDFCRPMLELSQPKIVNHTESTILVEGDACQLPVAPESVDGITVGWGMRNVADKVQAHKEIYRILKKNAVFVSLDCSIPKNPLIRAASNLVNKFGLPLLGRVFGKRSAYEYLPQSVKTFGTREDICDQMRQAGFVEVSFHDLFFGNICVFRGVKR